MNLIKINKEAQKQLIELSKEKDIFLEGNILKIIDAVRRAGGATVEGGRLVSHGAGFQVSIGEEVKNEDINLLALYIDVYDLKAYGLWFDDSAGVWYLDTKSAHIMDQEEAEALGRKHKQRAIWDWKAGAAIYL
jgi:hypothetical protein